MKKVIAILLTGIMIVGNSGVALATDQTTQVDANNDKIFSDTGSAPTSYSERTVKGKYVSGASTTNTYSVTITWGDMLFDYEATGTQVWNPDTHSYSGSTQGTWKVRNGDGTGNAITVTNDSNVAIDARFSYTAKSGISGITQKFTCNSVEITDEAPLNIQTADGLLKGDTNLTKDVLLELDGKPTGVSSNDVDLGTVKVTIS